MRFAFLMMAFPVLVALIVGSAGGCTRDEQPVNELNVVLIANVKGLDPIHVNEVYAHKVVGHLFESLLDYDYFQPRPTLVALTAQTMPQVSKDGLTYTIKIKKGIRFQDDECFPGRKGRELTAEDYLYSWKRVADATNVSENYGMIEGRIKGLSEWRAAWSAHKIDFDTPVAGLKAPDHETLIITLNRPYYQLNYVLAMSFMAAVPHEAVEHYGKEFLNHPVGTGPFQLQEWVRNNQITLTRNPGYRELKFPVGVKGMEADAGRRLPLVDRIHFFEITEDQSRWLNFMKGNLDISGIPKDNFDAAVERQTKQVKPEYAAKGIRIHHEQQGIVVYQAFNMDDPFLGKHKKVRQAISLANDRKTYIDKFYNGRAEVATLPYPPMMDAFDPNFKNPYVEFDVEKAKQLLAGDGFAGGKGIPELTFEIQNSTTGRQDGEFLQQHLAMIGIKLTVKLDSWPELMERISTRKAQIWAQAWSADYPDPETFLQLFYGPNASPGNNSTNFKNAKFDQLFEKAALLAPGHERDLVYQKMSAIVVEECPWVLMAFRDDYFLSHAWTRNYIPTELVNAPFLYIGLDAQKRVQNRRAL